MAMQQRCTIVMAGLDPAILFVRATPTVKKIAGSKPGHDDYWRSAGVTPRHPQEMREKNVQLAR
jgi:hypothetical protein